MKIVTGIALLIFGMQAFAAGTRQTITCSEKGRSKYKHTMEAKFNPSVVLDTVWSREKGHDVIITHKLGKEDARGTTTARTKFTAPDNLSTAGTYAFVDYYEVNHPENAGSGYSDRFGGGAYRTTHGSSKDQTDIMFYYPEEVVGKEAKGFPGLVTYQPSYVDQGYMHIDMTCESELN